MLSVRELYCEADNALRAHRLEAAAPGAEFWRLGPVKKCNYETKAGLSRVCWSLLHR
jgi:hypothetical protein